ncbi:hypothetical protein NL676_014592 [Syzygium grande]|nr:hypothetical protein NL676_014592 [Syzygium grande]
MDGVPLSFGGNGSGGTSSSERPQTTGSEPTRKEARSRHRPDFYGNSDLNLPPQTDPELAAVCMRSN